MKIVLQRVVNSCPKCGKETKDTIILPGQNAEGFCVACGMITESQVIVLPLNDNGSHLTFDTGSNPIWFHWPPQKP